VIKMLVSNLAERDIYETTFADFNLGAVPMTTEKVRSSIITSTARG